MRLQPPSPKQARSIREANARINIWHGSVRSGKTIASLIRWASAIDESVGSGDLVMVGKTIQTLERNAIRPLRWMLGGSAVSYTSGAVEARILGKRVDILSANDERAEEKIRGGTFESAYGDEVTLWPESAFRMLMTRLSPPGAKGFFTTNPDAPKHWLKTDYIDRAAELNLRAWHFNLRDNRTLTSEYIDALYREYTGLWRRRFIDGLWVVAEGAIWDAFDTDLHVESEVPAGVEFERFWVAVDYGTSNPFVALLFGGATDGATWVLDEWRWDSRKHGRQLTDAQYRTEIAKWIEAGERPVDRIWVDPSAASFIVECRQNGLDMVGPARNDVLDGLRLVASELAADKLFILDRCEDLIAEIGGYAWDPKAQQRGEDKPLKIDDHGPDALRYGVYTNLRGRISGLVA